ncbi:hypothetical protein [Streptomyces canus]|uniref:hypothetical protein n=1 Tax=Streptomyces canus TaxID=58343 RepID=UPI003801BB98
MGKRVLAAFGVVAPMDGLLVSRLSAAPTSADAAATSSTAERTGSSEEAQLRAPYRQAVAEGGRLVVFTGGDRAQAAEHHVVADVVHLQTLDDFPRWKKEGSLENCPPVGCNSVHPLIKEDTDTYRFDSLKKPLAQHPRFVRGTRDSAGLVGTGDHVADFGSGGSASGLSTVTLPRKSPWVAWPQTGVPPQERSIPGRRQAVPEPAAVQRCAGARNRARTDVAPPAGPKGIFDHATMKPLGLGPFMSDRTALDRYEARLSLSLCDVRGANSSDPTSSAATRSTSRAPKAEPLLDTGCPSRSGSRRTPRREAISPTITLHPRKHA